MNVNIKKRSFVKILSYLVAVLAVAVIYALTGWNGYMKERQKNEYGYQRALLSLSETIDSIDVTLQKTLCAGSAEQFASLAAKLCTQSATAKSELGQMPSSLGELDNVNRFISQVGEYALSLANKRYLDEDLTEDELKQLKELEKYTAKLRLTMDELIARGADSGVWLESEAKQTAGNTQGSNSIGTMAEDFTEYPTLIYDGPFSDHIYDKKPSLVKNMEKVTREKALETAKKYSVNDEIEYSRSVDGNLPLYVFSKDNIEIGVTVQGGIIAYMVNGRQINSSKLDAKEAEKLAEKYLNEHGFSGVTGNYYEIYSNCCVYNFTCVEDDVVIYPDLIKVTVALDNGEIVELDARDYVMNHRERGKLTAKKSEQEAKEIVSRQLKIEKSQLAVIPTDGKNEKLCWEFLCSRDDMAVLVYVNAENLTEEKILLIVDGENGKLTI